MFRMTPSPPAEPKLVQEFTLPLLFSIFHVWIARWPEQSEADRAEFCALLADTNARAARAVNAMPPAPEFDRMPDTERAPPATA